MCVRKEIVVVLLGVFLLFSGSAYASTVTTGKIVKVGTYGDGLLFIKLDTNIAEAGCNHFRFDVPPGYSQLKNWLSIAITAKVSGAVVVVGTNGCLNGRPSVDETSGSFFYLEE